MKTSGSRDKAAAIGRLAQDKKAEEIVIIEIGSLSSVCEYLVVAGASSERQVQAIAMHIEEELRKDGARPLGIEGMGEGRWVLMDYDDVVAHIFLNPVRSHFDIEGLWVDAPSYRLEEDGTLSARQAPGRRNAAASDRSKEGAGGEELRGTFPPKGGEA